MQLRPDEQPEPGRFDADNARVTWPLFEPWLLGAFFAPLLLALLARHRALNGKDEHAARWFTFANRVHLLRALAPIAWILVMLGQLTQGSPLVAWITSLGGTGYLLAFCFALVPIALLPALLGLVIHDVARRLDTTDFTWRETLTRTAWQLATAVVPAILLGLGTIAWAARQPMLVGSMFVSAAAAALFCFTRSQKGLTLTPHSVTQGELRDRIFELGTRAGVTLQQVYVLPMKKLRMANAFAVHGRVVMLTDLLLERLTRAEVDAILAHEIAHLRRGDPLKLLLARLACFVVPVMIALVSGWNWGAPLLAAGVALSAWISRRIERATDLEALRLGATPQALAGGLAKLARLSHVPLRWSGWVRWIVTHPSIEERARYLGAAAGLAPAEVPALLAGGGADGDHYALPMNFENGGRLFSTPFKHGVTSRNTLQMLVLVSLVPAAVFAEARWLAPEASLRLPMTLLALLLTPVIALLIANFLAVQPLRALERKLAARLGLGAKPAADGWQLTGLAPHAESRLYEGFVNWELGFVRLAGDAIEFAGEEARFALTRDAVIAIELAGGAPTWIPSQAARLRWRDAEGGEHALRFTPLDVDGVHQIGARSKRLAEAIARWQAGENAEAGRPRTIVGPPPAGEVTSMHPAAYSKPGVLVPLFVFDLAIALGVCLLFQLPLFAFAGPGWLDVTMIALATQAFLMVPLWRSGKDAAPADGDAEAKRSMAA